MSALWQRFLTILCLPCVALSNPGKGGVEWRNLGESITIQCRIAGQQQKLLSLKRGLQREELLTANPKGNTISKGLRQRVKIVGVFPNLDLVFTNLTMEDTGPYWCEYSKILDRLETKDGDGAVLLVVKGEREEKCAPENTQLLVGALVCCAALLLIIITGFLLWLVFKTITGKAKHTISNDVYEDMRGTLRR